MSLKRKHNNKKASSSRETLESLLYEASPMCEDMCNEVMDYVWPRTMTGELLTRYELKDSCVASRLAIDPQRGRLYLSGNMRHTVNMISEDGKILHQWGGFGKGKGTFHDPVGVAVFAQEVFITDYENQLVQVFSTKGVFVRQWSTRTTDSPNLSPAEIDIDPKTQRVYVMMAGYKRICVFTLQGTFIYSVNRDYIRHVRDICAHNRCLFALGNCFICIIHPERKCYIHLQCKDANALIIEGDEIFVATKDPYCVQVYSKKKDGRLLREIGKGVLKCPFSLAWYRGKLYVYDQVLKSILIFV